MCRNDNGDNFARGFVNFLQNVNQNHHMTYHTSKYIPKRTGGWGGSPHKNLYANVQSSIIQNRQKWKQLK